MGNQDWIRATCLKSCGLCTQTAFDDNRGRTAISSEADCKKAATAFGLTWGSTGSWGNEYRGCYFGKGRVFWNTHQNPHNIWEPESAYMLCRSSVSQSSKPAGDCYPAACGAKYVQPCMGKGTCERYDTNAHKAIGWSSADNNKNLRCNCLAGINCNTEASGGSSMALGFHEQKYADKAGMASAHILPDVMAFKGPEDNKICDPEGVRDMIECDESKPQKSSYYEVNVINADVESLWPKSYITPENKAYCNKQDCTTVSGTKKCRDKTTREKDNCLLRVRRKDRVILRSKEDDTKNDKSKSYCAYNADNEDINCYERMTWHYASPTGGHYGGGSGAGKFQFDILSVDIEKNVFAMENVLHKWCWDLGNAIECHGSKANSFNNDNDMKFTWTNEYDKK